MSRRVLIADPDRPLAEEYRAALEQKDFDVAIATNGRDCIDRLHSWKPDVFVLEPELLRDEGDDVQSSLDEFADKSPVPVMIVSNSLLMHSVDVIPEILIVAEECYIKPLSANRLVHAIQLLFATRGTFSAFGY